jgi:hypothetical protein
VKVLLQTVLGVARYGVSKAEFSNYEDEKTSLSRYVKTVSPIFFPVCVSGIRPVHKVVGGTNSRRDWHARPGRKVRKFLASLDISETLCPSRVRPAQHVLFHVFMSERHTPAGESIIAGKYGKLHDPYFTW